MHELNLANLRKELLRSGVAPRHARAVNSAARPRLARGARRLSLNRDSRVRARPTFDRRVCRRARA